jgi:hypothetical protein
LPRSIHRAEPSEALKASVVWGTGLDQPCVMLSENQVDSFSTGLPVSGERFNKGNRGAFFIQSSFAVPAGGGRDWRLLADVSQGPSQLAELFKCIRQDFTRELIDRDIESGSQRLLKLVGKSDGCQVSSDALLTSRHFSNTLFNVMRGGTFDNDYRFSLPDFLKFVESWNAPLRQRFVSVFDSLEEPLTRDSVLLAIESIDDADMERLAMEYLPLVFSRRHGDPSRPWNHFSIDIRNADGSDKLNYQGNWRDIFQNWEALAISYPEYIESFIARFVNATTADGYNPYRITRDGFDWELLSPEDPWSNIGYWGDHQVNYLVKFLELSGRYHPGALGSLLTRQIFVYANVPYRVKSHDELVNDPISSIEFDYDLADTITRKVEETGHDGKLLNLEDGTVCRVNLFEKLMVPALSKISNLVPGGGIWMNTQRPEWNDANNALAGYGLSMVTLCYLRRYLVQLAELLANSENDAYAVSVEVLEFFTGLENVLKNRIAMFDAVVIDKGRKEITDQLGRLAEVYRTTIYHGFSGSKGMLECSRALTFIDNCLDQLDFNISHSRRPDGLFHSYNLVQFGNGGYGVENLDEMLEGQVAVLSSGYLGLEESLKLLKTLRESKIYSSEKNSYYLYPYRKLKHFLEKNVIEQSMVSVNKWIQSELKSGRDEFVEKDCDGLIHFNSRFRNSVELRAALEGETGIDESDIDTACNIFETVFDHRQFTGRSGSMYKYEGLGCIYWHMVSKLLLATQEILSLSPVGMADERISGELMERYDEIKDGLGVHKSPDQYGAFPIDPYSHTPAFTGVQQPGMTGQAKEDLITRFGELGVIIDCGEISFAPMLLNQHEFLTEPVDWRYSVGGDVQSEHLEAGSLAFCLCGVPVIYRLSDQHAMCLHMTNNEKRAIKGASMGKKWSQSLFRREGRIRKVVVDIPRDLLR